MDKVYQSIAEVAEQLDVQPSTLRFWETQFTDLKPLKSIGGRRQYRAEDIDLLKKIHFYLQTQKFTIKGAQKALREGKKITTTIPKDAGADAFVAEMESVKDLLERYI